MQVATLDRQFKFQNNGKDVILDDPNPDLTPEEVMEMYSGQYPDLTTATVKQGKVEKDKMVYKFETTLGTKG